VQKILWEVRAQILGKGGFLKTAENRCVCEAYCNKKSIVLVGMGIHK